MLPEFVQLTDYVYTLLGLTVATLILVINIPHIMKLWQELRKVHNLFWRWAAYVSKSSVRWLFAIRKLPAGRIDEQDLEMQNGNMGEVVRQEGV